MGGRENGWKVERVGVWVWVVGWVVDGWVDGRMTEWTNMQVDG